jgi:hypothetical protein
MARVLEVPKKFQKIEVPLVLIALFALIALIALIGLIGLIANHAPPRKTAFTIRAQTDVVTVQPDCGQALTWDLPPGEVRALGADAPADLQRKIGPVSIVIRAGAQAVLERRETGEWRVVVKPLDGVEICTVQSPSGATDGQRPVETVPPADRISVLRLKYTAANGSEVENESVAPSADGFAYRSIGDGADPPPLRLAGRVLLGSPVLEGGGWSDARAGMLRSATIEGRVRDSVGEQLSVLLREDVDPGSMIDTHACLDRHQTEQQLAACAATGGDAAVGFAAASSDGIVKSIQVVVHRLTKRIGVLPYGGEQRSLAVTWWTALLNNPLAQQVAAALIIVTTLLGHYRELNSLLSRFLPWVRAAIRRSNP